MSKGRPSFPHLSCYFCDICLGILGNALSLVCPLTRESGSSVSPSVPPSPDHHYLTMFFFHRVAYSWVILRPSFVCPLFEQWLRCCYLFLHGLPETHHADRKRKAIRLAVHENTFTLPSSNSFLELKFLITLFFFILITLFFFILLFVLCQSSLLCVASTTPINFLQLTNAVFCCVVRHTEEHTMEAWWPRDIYPQIFNRKLARHICLVWTFLVCQ